VIDKQRRADFYGDAAEGGEGGTFVVTHVVLRI
jgi:hypothetical protein